MSSSTRSTKSAAEGVGGGGGAAAEADVVDDDAEMGGVVNTTTTTGNQTKKQSGSKRRRGGGRAGDLQHEESAGGRYGEGFDDALREAAPSQVASIRRRMFLSAARALRRLHTRMVAHEEAVAAGSWAYLQELYSVHRELHTDQQPDMVETLLAGLANLATVG